MRTLSKSLLDWYAESGRDLPWRVKGGAHPNPYVVLVSELMLQQTTVKTVIPYFERFMKRFPTIASLAAATQEEVYTYWQGLGYYTRARSLHNTAKIIMSDFGGIFPHTRADVLKLKGIGPYTVASFLALAFNAPETVVDGNVMRIICRLYHLTAPLDDIRAEISAKAESLTDKKHPADYASAIMDLGATVCTPKNPRCLECPWNKSCQSKSLPDLEQIPARHRLPKKEKSGFVFIITNSKGEFFIRRRTEKGLLSGLYEFPWSEDKLFTGAKDSGLTVSHVFTHFKLTLHIYFLKMQKTPTPDGCFIRPEKLGDYPVSTLMKKVFATAQNHLELFENPKQ